MLVPARIVINQMTGLVTPKLGHIPTCPGATLCKPFPQCLLQTVYSAVVRTGKVTHMNLTCGQVSFVICFCGDAVVGQRIVCDEGGQGICD